MRVLQMYGLGKALWMYVGVSGCGHECKGGESAGR